MKAAITFLIMCVCVVAFMDRALDAATGGEVQLIMGWIDSLVLAITGIPE